MHVCIHQAESQDDDVEILKDDVDPVHPGAEIRVVPEDNVYVIAVRREVPAVFYGGVLSFDKGLVEAEIG